MSYQELSKLNKDQFLNLKFLSFEKYDTIRWLIDKSKNIIEVFNNLKKLRKDIDKYNPDFNYKVSKNVLDKFKLDIAKRIENPRRINLIADFIFDYEKRDMTISFTEYDFDFDEAKENVMETINEFKFRGYESKKQPKRKNKTVKNTQNTVPKTQVNLENKLLEYFSSNDLEDLMKIIVKSTDDIRPISKKDVMDMYRKFHPDKYVNKSEKAVKVCNIVSSKLSVLKKKCDGNSSPVRTVGSIFDEVWNIVK